jgi:hypothetical protein
MLNQAARIPNWYALPLPALLQGRQEPTETQTRAPIGLARGLQGFVNENVTIMNENVTVMSPRHNCA